MKLLYILTIDRYVITLEENSETYVARIAGLVFYSDVCDILTEYKKGKILFDPAASVPPEFDAVVMGEFFSSEEIDDIFCEYLI